MAHDLPQGFRLIESETERPVYPLPWDGRLASFDFWQVHMHNLGGSRFFATASNEEVGAALRLWNSAYRDQNPGGTLPCDEVELGIIAGYGRDPVAWRAVQPAVMRGWFHVQVVDEAGRDVCVRMAHPMVTHVAIELWNMKSRMRREKAGSQERQALYRIRGALAALGYEGFAKDEATVREVRAWLVEQGLNGARHNVEEAIFRLKGPKKR